MGRIPDDALAIVNATRQWAEKHRHRYRNDMGGMCAVAAAELWRRLNKAGHDVQLAQAFRSKSKLAHVFVVYRGRYLIDITATQFGYEKVEIRWLYNFLHPWFWKPASLYPNDEELHLDQIRYDWPSDQLANGHSWLTTSEGDIS